MTWHSLYTPTTVDTSEAIGCWIDTDFPLLLLYYYIPLIAILSRFFLTSISTLPVLPPSIEKQCWRRQEWSAQVKTLLGQHLNKANFNWRINQLRYLILLLQFSHQFSDGEIKCSIIRQVQFGKKTFSLNVWYRLLQSAASALVCWAI